MQRGRRVGLFADFTALRQTLDLRDLDRARWRERLQGRH
jgi:hypothetical protein